jgi:hypothetical protein
MGREETGIVTALSAGRKIHTVLHHEGLRKNKKKLRELSIPPPPCP